MILKEKKDHKIVIWKASGEVVIHKIEDDNIDVKSLLNADDIEKYIGYHHKLKETIVFDMIADSSAKDKKLAKNERASYSYNEYLKQEKPNQIFNRDIYGDVAIEIKA